MDVGPIDNLQDIAERVDDLKEWISNALQDLNESPALNDLKDQSKITTPTAISKELGIKPRLRMADKI